MNDLYTSLIRTAVPYLIGLLVSWLATKGIAVSDAQTATLIAALAFAVGTGYYLAVRYLESKWPKLGLLLGVPQQPTYTK